MTVRALIKILQKQNPRTKVVVSIVDRDCDVRYHNVKNITNHIRRKYDGGLQEYRKTPYTEYVLEIE
jgi:hypothetical protein